MQTSPDGYWITPCWWPGGKLGIVRDPFGKAEYLAPVALDGYGIINLAVSEDQKALIGQQRDGTAPFSPAPLYLKKTMPGAWRRSSRDLALPEKRPAFQAYSAAPPWLSNSSRRRHRGPSGRTDPEDVKNLARRQYG